MNETLNFVSALVEGVLLGAFFFAGLWWTVKEVPSSNRPVLRFLGSLLLRTSASVAGFYFVSGGHWERLLMCLLGFFIARCIVMRLVRLSEEESNQLTNGANHAT
jgi:F1F0 ATPase subunit 2